MTTDSFGFNLHILTKQQWHVLVNHFCLNFITIKAKSCYLKWMKYHYFSKLLLMIFFTIPQFRIIIWRRFLTIFYSYQTDIFVAEKVERTEKQAVVISHWF